MPVLDMANRVFGRLTVMKFSRSKNRKSYWHCRCNCGTSVEVRTDQLTRGITRSCGCLQRETAAELMHSKLSDESKKLRKLRALREAKGLPPNLNIRDLTGRRFHKLKVLKFVKIDDKQQSLWRCLCDCGKKTTVTAARLNFGWTKSCGCLQREQQTKPKEYRLSHGHTRTGQVSPEYWAWCGLKQRCYNPDNQKFEDYGGRGITVCKRWLKSFKNFYKDMGPKPSTLHSLDRKNNDGNYTKRNCQWALPDQQANNRRKPKKRTVKH